MLYRREILSSLHASVEQEFNRIINTTPCVGNYPLWIVFLYNKDPRELGENLMVLELMEKGFRIVLKDLMLQLM